MSQRSLSGAQAKTASKTEDGGTPTSPANKFLARDGAAFSSIRTDWNTPPKVLDLVRQLGPIGLDPCSNPASIVNAARAVELPEDGLAIPWESEGLVFVNPPYGRGDIEQWVMKCHQEGMHGREIVALLPARTDTIWFQDFCAPPESSVVCLWKGRVRFVGAESPAPFPSALVYWGARIEKFIRVFWDYGAIWRGPTPPAVELAGNGA